MSQHSTESTDQLCSLEFVHASALPVPEGINSMDGSVLLFDPLHTRDT